MKKSKETDYIYFWNLLLGRKVVQELIFKLKSALRI